MNDSGHKRLRVLMLGPYPANPRAIDGGVSAVVTYLSQALAARSDIELFGARIGAEDAPAGSPETFGFPVFDIAKSALGLTSSYRSQRRRLAELVHSIQPDIIHAQGADLPGFLAIKSGIPSVITVHGMIGEDARYRSRFAERMRGRLTSWLVELPTVRRAKALILISPYVGSYHGRRIGGRVFNIANPVSSAYFDVQRNVRPGRMLYAGRVIPRKGVLELVKAVAAIPQELQPKLVIAGALSDHEYVRSVRAAISETGTEHRIEMNGLMDEAALLREFETAQALVLPSFQETAPMVIQQAMAAGVPVIASRICGIPFQIDDGVSGFLIEPGNVADLSDRLVKVLAEPGLAQRLGASARETARASYLASAVAQATVDTYRSTVAEAA